MTPVYHFTSSQLAEYLDRAREAWKASRAAEIERLRDEMGGMAMAFEQRQRIDAAEIERLERIVIQQQLVIGTHEAKSRYQQTMAGKSDG